MENIEAAMKRIPPHSNRSRAGCTWGDADEIRCDYGHIGDFGRTGFLSDGIWDLIRRYDRSV